MKQEENAPVLILKFIGVDDLSYPTYKDPFGHLWKDTNLGAHVAPSLYSVTNDSIYGEPLRPIRQKYSFHPAPYQRSIYEFQYRRLSKLKSDCEYFLGCGRRSVSILYRSDPRQHIDSMKEFWESLPENAKPEWLIWQQILDYEKSICGE